MSVYSVTLPTTAITSAGTIIQIASGNAPIDIIRIEISGTFGATATMLRAQLVRKMAAATVTAATPIPLDKNAALSLAVGGANSTGILAMSEGQDSDILWEQGFHLNEGYIFEPDSPWEYIRIKANSVVALKFPALPPTPTSLSARIVWREYPTIAPAGGGGGTPNPNLFQGTSDYTCQAWSLLNATLNTSTKVLTLPSANYSSFRQTPVGGFQPNTTYTFHWTVQQSGSAIPFALAYFDGSANNYSPTFTSTSSAVDYSFTFTTGATIGPAALVGIGSDPVSLTGGSLIITNPKIELGSTYTGFLDVPCQQANKLLGYWHWEFTNFIPFATLMPHITRANYLAVIMGQSAGGGTGSVFFSKAASDSEVINGVAAWKAAGKTAIFTIGGAGDGGITIQNSTNSNQFVQSVIPIIDQFGFQGISWDLESGQTPYVGGGAWNPTWVADASNQLKAHYGNQFIIAMDPRPYEIRTSDGVYTHLITALGPTGYDYIHPQFYGPNGDDNFYINGFILDRDLGIPAIVTNGGVPATKILLGCSSLGAGGGAPGWPQTYATAYADLQTAGYNLKGAINWEDVDDSGHNYTYHQIMGNAVFGP